MGISKTEQTAKVRKNKLRSQRAGGDGSSFPLRLCKVTRVDPVRRIVSLYALSGEGDSYDNVNLTSPGAGARHFLGTIPEVNDICVVGYSQAESGYSRTPYIVGWLIPGPQAGYDWLMTSPTSERELNLTPSMKKAVEGSFGRRRHKLRQMEKGNVLGSSSQGSDLLLNESVLLVNRRGNEILLRDQDQALVVRTLQQFHAGAGFRVYGGMVQRDGTLLPTQMFGDSVNWNADKQIDSEGKTLSPHELEESESNGALTPNNVFQEEFVGTMGSVDPQDILQRGLFIDENGAPYDGRVRPDAVYGGKPIYRVSLGNSGENAVLDEGTDVFTEYRIEVAHTSDGTLPVTEQTDGIDIDRILPSAPSTGVDGTGDANPLNRSPNAAMVEFILGTAIGNDPFNDRSSYGLPLTASLYDKNGKFAPGIRGVDSSTPISEHAAFLLRVKNPTDPKAPDAFLAITKGGTFRSYFPGTGSKSHQEFYQTGKQVSLGQDLDGVSQKTEGDGTLSMINTGKGRNSDNVGLELRSESGAVSIFAGGITSAGAGTPSTNPNLTPAGTRVSLLLKSAHSTLVEAVESLKLVGQNVLVGDADTVQVSANTSVGINSGDVVNISTKTLGVTVNGKAEYNYGGPKNALPTNGPSRTTTFNATPLTGAIGDTVDEYLLVYGGRDETIRLGRHETTVNVGSWNITSMGLNSIEVGPGSGIHLATGLPFLDNRLDLETTGASLTSNVGGVTVQATKGSATLRGLSSASVQSAFRVSLQAPMVQVTTPTPFLGGVLTDGCINPISGRSFALSGSLGVATFRVGV